MEELNYKDEVENLIKPTTEVLEADKKEAFLKEYRELVRKHGFDFMLQPPAVVKVEFAPKEPLKIPEIK